MSKVEIELDELGILALLSSAEVQNHINKIAHDCVQSCSGNYEVESSVKSGRAVAKIKTADEKTFYRNLKTNELIKATSPNKHR